MRYALLIYSDDSQPIEPGSPEADQIMQDYFAFNTYLTEKGAHLGGEALHGVDTATTIRVRGSEAMTTDGPFAETKEQLGGFYLIEATDLDEALEIAARCPGSHHGSIEVRPVWEVPQA
ncbi:MAG: YciI family protein [Acidimicrobiia bacterium]|nr:YciI family protein [Acidimicrobiia bacterium]